MSIPVSRSTTEVISTFGATSEQQKWAAAVAIGAQSFHPLSKLKEGSTDLNKRLPGSPIITTRDTTFRGGTKVNLTTFAPLGGFGISGSGTRSNMGEQQKFRMYQMQTGVHWAGVKRDKIAASQTQLGSVTDVQINQQLRGLFGWFTGNHLEATLRAGADTDPSACVLYANERVSTNDLGSADTFNINDAYYIEDQLAANQAEPFAISQKGATDVLRYLIMGPHVGVRALEMDADWQGLLKYADTRGEANHIFGGGLPLVGGTEIFKWTVQNTSADGPQGAFCYAHAFLGEAIAAGTAAFSMKGGRNANGGALTDRPYFIHFPGARWNVFQQEVIAQETSDTKYLLIKNKNTGKFAMFSYTTIPNGNGSTVADANTITIASGGANRLGDAGYGVTTLGRVTYDSGVWAGKCHDWAVDGAIPVGSEVWPCNDKGQTFTDFYGMSKHMIVDGYGMLDQETALGRRTINKNDDHQSKFEWGFEMSYGATPVLDANGIPKGIVRLRAAWNPRGLPTIASGLS